MVEKVGGDRRIQRTRRLLQEALVALILEKGYDAVTVQDVLDRADVGRSTFYAHFHDKEDLWLSGFERLRIEFDAHLASADDSPESPWAVSLFMFRHAQEQRAVYKALAGKQAGAVALAHIQKYFATMLHSHLKMQPRKKKQGVPLEVATHYLVTSFIAMLTWWLDNDLPYSAEQMNEYYRQLVQPGVEACFI